MVNFTGLPNVSINKQAGAELCLAQFNIQWVVALDFNKNIECLLGQELFFIMFFVVF